MARWGAKASYAENQSTDERAVSELHDRRAFVKLAYNL
jgi:hypothetical protein